MRDVIATACLLACAGCGSAFSAADGDAEPPSTEAGDELAAPDTGAPDGPSSAFVLCSVPGGLSLDLPELVYVCGTGWEPYVPDGGQWVPTSGGDAAYRHREWVTPASGDFAIVAQDGTVCRSWEHGPAPAMPLCRAPLRPYVASGDGTCSVVSADGGALVASDHAGNTATNVGSCSAP